MLFRSTTYGEETKKEDKVTFTLESIKAPGITISFIVKAKDSYYYGLDVPTNTKAEISFKDPLDESKLGSGIFPVPTVDINPKMGKINVTKYVQNLQGKQAPENDIFSVLIKGNDSQYNLSLKSGDSNKQTMEFILKGNNEYNDDIYKQAYDTSNFADIVQVDNYATVKIGNYNVDELVPMNYTKTSTKISTNANSNKVETEDRKSVV